MNRYDTNPARLKGIRDITEYVKDINEKVNVLSSSFQLGNSSIEDGDLLVLNGDIRVGETDGTTVLRLLHGATPEIRMYPLGDTDTHQIALFGFDAGSVTSKDQAFQISIEKLAGFVLDGGKLLLTRGTAVLAHDSDGGEEAFLWISADGFTSETLRFRGSMRNSVQYDNRQTFYPGYESVSAGVSTWTHTYPSTWVDTPIPVATINYNGATTQWNLDSFTSSSFTVRLGTTAGGKDLVFWVVRVST